MFFSAFRCLPHDLQNARRMATKPRICVFRGKKPIFCGFLPFSSRIFAQKNAKKAFFFSNRNCQKKKRLFVDTFLCCLHPLRLTTHRRHRHKKYVSNDTTFSPYVNNFEKTFSKKFLAAFLSDNCQYLRCAK